MFNLIQHIEEAYGCSVQGLFPYGSQVYGTAGSQSDFDYIAVIDQNLEQPANLDLPDLNVNITLYSPSLFQQKLNEHEISVLECLFLPPNLILKKTNEFAFTLSLPKLRAAISAKASNSWVKAKKKMIVEKDYAPYIGVKSLFHCFRIIEFGRQIAIHGKIVDYEAANGIWKELSLVESWTWPQLENTYKELYNKACTEFRLVAPKE